MVRFRRYIFRVAVVAAALGGTNGTAWAVRQTDEQRLIAMERASWVAWQRADISFWRTFLSDDHVEVHMGGGTSTKDQVIAGIASGVCRVSSYQVDHFRYHRFGPDTALL